jgi:hypothetical protein
VRLLPPPVAQRGASTEPDVDHALAAPERLNEIAESMMRRLDELLMPPPLCATARAGSSALDLRSLDETARLTRGGEVAPERRDWVYQVTGLRRFMELTGSVVLIEITS